MNEEQPKRVEFTAEQRAKHREIRETFRDWHPGPEELIASGEAERLGLNVIDSASGDSEPESWVQKRAQICGGAACVRDTRISVWGLVAYRRLGLDEAEIMRRVAGLAPADLAVAWAYVADHPDEIEQAIRDNEGGTCSLKG